MPIVYRVQVEIDVGEGPHIESYFTTDEPRAFVYYEMHSVFDNSPNDIFDLLCNEVVMDELRISVHTNKRETGSVLDDLAYGTIQCSRGFDASIYIDYRAINVTAKDVKQKLAETLKEWIAGAEVCDMLKMIEIITSGDVTKSFGGGGDEDGI